MASDQELVVPPGFGNEFRLTHLVNGRAVTERPLRTHPLPASLRGRLSGEVPIADTEAVDRFLSEVGAGLGRWLATPVEARRLAVLAVADSVEAHLETSVATFELELGVDAEVARTHVVRNIRRMREICDEPDSARFGGAIPGITGLVASRHRIGKTLMAAVARLLLNDSVVVLKPSTNAPLVAFQLIRWASDVLPPGVVNLVFGDEETVDALISNPLVASIFLDGSPEAIAHAQRLAEVCRKPLVLYADDPAFT